MVEDWIFFYNTAILHLSITPRLPDSKTLFAFLGFAFLLFIVPHTYILLNFFRYSLGRKPVCFRKTFRNELLSS